MDLDFSNLANNMMGGNSKEKQDKKFQNNKKNSYQNYQSNKDYQNNKGYQSNRDYQNNKGYQNNNNYRDNQAVPYVGAPYNFVSFSDTVYEYDETQLTSHATFSDDLFTGEIEYEIEAKTPIIVDDGTGNFCKNSYGQYAIPGSTMRGLIRNNVQILGLASMNDDIDDYVLMYRNVASGKEKDKYNKILGSKPVPVGGNKLSVLLNVKAGYIKKEQGKYVIYKTCVDSIKKDYKEMNYYIVSERTIVKEYLSAKKYNKTFSFEFFEQKGKMQHEINKEFRREVKNGRVHYIGKENKEYEPYFDEISYELAGDKDITAVGESGKYKHQGYVISTGKMNEKKAIYIIPKLDDKKPCIPIPEKDIRAFQIDIEKRKNTLKQFGGREFFDLPKEGEMKPVFYIPLGGRLYFGFTPRLRLFYDNTIKKGLNLKHKPEVVDYAKAIFGYTNQTSSYKSRVSFSDAVMIKDTTELEQVELVLAEPKPTSYSDYLKPVDGEAVTYNENFELRGVKQYWLRDEVVPAEAKKVESTFCPLEAKTSFIGKVRFYNLKKEELGLLLWAIKLNENSWMNVGKAKPYGYGNISLNILSAKRVDLKDAYDNGENLNLDPLKNIDVDDLILSYKEEINKFLGGRNIDDLQHIKEFFAMKDSTNMPEKDKIRYMDINKKEYQNRKDEVLPSIEETMKKSKK